MAKVLKGEKRGAKYAGRWLVDYRDAAGVRHLPSFDTKAAAEDFYATTARVAAGRPAPQADRKTTLQACFDAWLAIAANSLKQRSQDIYTSTWRLYCAEVLGKREARTLTRRDGETLLMGLKERLGRNTLRIVYLVLSSTCGEAVELGLLPANPMAGLWKRLRFSTKRGAEESGEVKALTVEQAGKFLAASEGVYFAFFHLLIETGLRLGEALALQWEDVNLDAATLHVARTLTCNDTQVGPTKSGTVRDVDLSAGVLATLRAWMLKCGRREGVLFAELGQRGTGPRKAVGRAMHQTLARAGLPPHFTPHCLRHTYASLMLAVVEAPVTYVQRQLGHASIELTVHVYGSWIPHAKRYVDGLRLWQPLPVQPATTTG